MLLFQQGFPVAGPLTLPGLSVDRFEVTLYSLLLLDLEPCAVAHAGDGLRHGNVVKEPGEELMLFLKRHLCPLALGDVDEGDDGPLYDILQGALWLNAHQVPHSALRFHFRLPGGQVLQHCLHIVDQVIIPDQVGDDMDHRAHYAGGNEDYKS